MKIKSAHPNAVQAQHRGHRAKLWERSALAAISAPAKHYGITAGLNVFITSQPNLGITLEHVYYFATDVSDLHKVKQAQNPSLSCLSAAHLRQQHSP